jgi:osmoprotectant transport system ATP-binding protein
VIQLDAVQKSYGPTNVLAGVTLHVRKGQRLALVGQSGCGKSTLLRVLLGLVLPDAGVVTVGGARVGPESAEAIRLRCGYVIQDGGLFPHLTAFENVALVPRRRGWKQARIEERARELFDLTGLAPDLGPRYPRELSGGQKQRVGLMRALVLDPDMLLMDEPLGALDPVLRARMQRDLLGLFTSLGKTVLLVTHDMDEAAFLADEIAVMRRGEILQRGSFDELAANPADPFVAELVSKRVKDEGPAPRTTP